jgi:DNA repair protein RecN (Recombination protein N)
MLSKLYISNFALINEMDVSFPGKLSVITGETGAGKSIFLEALALVLGKRADAASLQNKNKKCVIEAEFDAGKLELKDFFEQEGIDSARHLVLRREINADGRSRSFLNDTPVSLAALKFLAEHLIDIHSQHQTLLLNQSNFQMEVLDAFAGNADAYKDYRKDFVKLTKLNLELRALQELELTARKELDYFQFLFDELNETGIDPGKLKKLEEESNTLENAEAIKSSLSLVSNAISGGESNALMELARMKQLLNGISKYSDKYKQYSERLNSLYIELKELGADVENEGNSVLYDPAKLDEVNTAIDKISRLLKKHHVISEEELVKVKTGLEEKLSSFNSLESKLNETKKQIDALKLACLKKANAISKTRAAAISPIEKEIKKILSELSMPNAIFKIEMTDQEEISVGGIDKIKFLFSANKGGTLSELQKVASGGELSRLMLALKSLLASKKELPSIIFDEIDTGVSGDVADKIGNILGKMGKSMQVVCITHLPQIASKGSHHLFVYKEDGAKQTTSHIKELNKDERITEIAKMLSTGNPTPSAVKNAKELLNMN